jgi:Uma2 family endonuclease
MGEAAKTLELLDAEAYLALEERSPVRHELLEGVPYAMAGATEAHNLIVGNLFYGLLVLMPGPRGAGSSFRT